MWARFQPAEAERRRLPCKRRRARLGRFADMLNVLFAPRPGLWEALGGRPLICRCEEVTAQEIAACIAAGCTTTKAIKDWTRAGMGLCQGRICRAMVSEIIAAQRSVELDSIAVPACSSADQAGADIGALAPETLTESMIEIGVDIGGTFTDVVLLRDDRGDASRQGAVHAVGSDRRRSPGRRARAGRRPAFASRRRSTASFTAARSRSTP